MRYVVAALVTGLAVLFTLVYLPLLLPKRPAVPVAHYLGAADLSESAASLPPGVLLLSRLADVSLPSAIGLLLSNDGYLVTATAGLDSRCEDHDEKSVVYVAGKSPWRGQVARCVVVLAGLAILRVAEPKTEAAELYALPTDSAGLAVRYLPGPHDAAQPGHLLPRDGDANHVALDHEPPTRPPMLGSPVWTKDGRLIGIVSVREGSAGHFKVATLGELLRALALVERQRFGGELDAGTGHDAAIR